jgi:hypothetical protein
MDSMHKIDGKYINLIELDKDEKLVCAVRKHPIGLINIYLSGLFISGTILTISVLAGIWLDQQSSFSLGFSVGAMVSIGGAILALVVVFFSFVAGFLYRNNVIIVTTDKIAQILYKNLIDRKISQLSLGELQDITVDQTGIFARIFKYGTLTIETAGEQNNYIFTYAPYPYECAKEIVGAHEDSIKKYGN